LDTLSSNIPYLWSSLNAAHRVSRSWETRVYTEPLLKCLYFCLRHGNILQCLCCRLQFEPRLLCKLRVWGFIRELRGGSRLACILFYFFYKKNIHARIAILSLLFKILLSLYTNTFFPSSWQVTVASSMNVFILTA
jgi:hypothetical protein